MRFLITSIFWWHFGLVFLGLALAKADLTILGVQTLVIAGVCFLISGVLGVIEDVRPYIK